MKPFFVVLDNIRSAENVGSIFRTADALVVDKIFLCGITPTPAHEKVGKTALGAEKTVVWEYHKQTWRLLEKLKEQGVFIAALEQTKKSVSLEKFKPKFPLALVLGHEVKGVSPSVLRLANAIVEIPMLGQKESLNVAVAFGIAGYEINKVRL
ncbi:MAG TPA: RNA methyltransferase [Candidatus Paceibacterota bacterium]|nr:RNA methyltransferase [Candidatus Paceibacterota bacterium]